MWRWSVIFIHTRTIRHIFHNNSFHDTAQYHNTPSRTTALAALDKPLDKWYNTGVGLNDNNNSNTNHIMDNNDNDNVPLRQDREDALPRGTDYSGLMKHNNNT